MTGLTGRCILIVEDEMLIALMLQSTLEALGYQVAGRSHTVADALAIIEETRKASMLLPWISI